MLDPSQLNRLNDTYINNTSSVLEMPELEYFAYEQYDIYDNKDYEKFLKDIERAVRMSYEYRQLIYYLKNTESMYECSFLSNVSGADASKVKIEIHHAPFTLYDIVCAVVKKRIACRFSIDIFSCACEVMWLHYMGYVGLYPVSSTAHELVHNGYLFVPTTLVRGNYKAFVDMYYDFISPDTLDALDAAEELTQDWLSKAGNTFIDYQSRIFSIHQTYISFKNRDINASIPPARSVIKNRIEDIKQQKKQLCRIINKPLNEEV